LGRRKEAADIRYLTCPYWRSLLVARLPSLQIDPGPPRKEFSGQVAGWSFRGLKPWQASADEIGEIWGITRLNGSFVNQGPDIRYLTCPYSRSLLVAWLPSLQIDPGPRAKEFSGQVAGWSFRGLKPWQASADEIGEIRGITRLNGSFVNQGPGFEFRKRQVTR
jgi:hypothetical protein